MAFQPKEMTQDTLRRLVDNLVRHFKNNPPSTSLKRSQLQEAVAHTLGFSSFHEAVTQVRKNTSPASPKTSKNKIWYLPESFLLPQTKELVWPSDWPHQKTDNPAPNLAKFSHEDFAQSLLLLAPEHKRKNVFEELCALNPHQSFYIIQGPMSLIPKRDKARQVKSQSLEVVCAHGSPSDIINHLIFYFGLSSPDASMWKGRAIAMVSSIVSALVYLRDNQNLSLNETVLLKHLDLSKVIGLSNNSHLPPSIINSLKTYLRSIPTYQEGVTVQSEVVNEQHGYLKMQLNQIVGESVNLSGAQSLFEVSDPTQKGLKNVQCHLPERSLADSEIGGVKQSMKNWSHKNGNGLVFVDIPSLDPSFWSFFINQLPHLLEIGHPVWIGLHSDADIPSSFRQMLTRRVKHIIQDSEYQYRA